MALCSAVLSGPFDETRDPVDDGALGSEAPWFVSMADLPPLEERLPSNPFTVHGYHGVYASRISIIGTFNVNVVDCSTVVPGATETPTDRPRSISIDERLTLLGSEGYVYNVANDIEFDNEKTVDVFIRPIKWSDGVILTAHDVAFSLELATKHGVYQPIFRYAPEPSQVIVKADHHVQIVFPESVANVDFLMSQIEIYPRHVWESTVDNLLSTNAASRERSRHFRICARNARILPSLGAYIFDSYNRDGGAHRIVYRANPYYFKVDEVGRQQPYFETAEHIVVDSVQAMLDYAATFTDEPLVIELPGTALDHIDRFLEMDNLRTRTFAVRGRGSALAYLFNYADADHAQLFQSPDFRRATLLAIDREAIKQIYRPAVTGVRVQTATLDWRVATAQDPYVQDLTRALELVEGTDFGSLQEDEFTISVIAHDTAASEAAELIEADWYELGIDATVERVTRQEMYRREREHDFDVILRPQYLHEELARQEPGWLVPPFMHREVGDTWKAYGQIRTDPCHLAEAVMKWISDTQYRDRDEAQYVESTQLLLDEYEQMMLIIGIVSPLPNVDLYGDQLDSILEDNRRGGDSYYKSR